MLSKNYYIPISKLFWSSRRLLTLKCILTRMHDLKEWHPTPGLLPGKSHGRRSLVGCSPWGSQESDMTERLHFPFSLSCTGEGNGNPLQCSCLENPRAGGAWWAAVYGVAQSRTRLKRLSSSSSSIMVLFLIFWGACISFHCYRNQWCWHFPPTVRKWSLFPVPSLRFVISWLVNDSHSNSLDVAYYCSFDLHFPNY